MSERDLDKNQQKKPLIKRETFYINTYNFYCTACKASILPYPKLEFLLG